MTRLAIFFSASWSNFLCKYKRDPARLCLADPYTPLQAWGTLFGADFEEFERYIQVKTNPAPRCVSGSDFGSVRGALQAPSEGRAVSSTEDQIAEIFVNTVNNLAMGRGYVTGLSRYRYQKNDPPRAKVDAALYREADAPAGEGIPDWTHIRLYIEFTNGGAQLEPFEDDDSDHPEASCRSSSATTSKNIRSLLVFLAYFESLGNILQGIDCRATPLAPTPKAYKLMDDFAQANPSEIPPSDTSFPLSVSPSPVLPTDQSTTPNTSCLCPSESHWRKY
ncbi:hypothetical protein C8Q78DRAFT_1083589 [Trametes maxima]|nr:hypothetical protein C8Q78DRAFT_1083589 [Trametes maxima]